MQLVLLIVTTFTLRRLFDNGPDVCVAPNPLNCVWISYIFLQIKISQTQTWTVTPAPKWAMPKLIVWIFWVSVKGAAVWIRDKSLIIEKEWNCGCVTILWLLWTKPPTSNVTVPAMTFMEFWALPMVHWALEITHRPAIKAPPQKCWFASVLSEICDGIWPSCTGAPPTIREFWNAVWWNLKSVN